MDDQSENSKPKNSAQEREPAKSFAGVKVIKMTYAEWLEKETSSFEKQNEHAYDLLALKWLLAKQQATDESSSTQ